MCGQSWATSPEARRAMQGNRSRDTLPEMRLRRAAHKLGLRYRVNALLPGLPTRRRRADLLFPGVRVAVFLDGCFWHGCPEHHRQPAANSQYWMTKVSRNMERDRETDALLRDAGWTVVRFWEHEDPNTAAESLRRLVAGRYTAGKDERTASTSAARAD
jgi:DNA mismatch endonuclease (patch repair protein)